MTVKEQSKVAQPIAVIIKIVYMFFADKKGSCPVAEEYARTVINLPTYPMMTRRQARKVVEIIKQWLDTK